VWAAKVLSNVFSAYSARLTQSSLFLLMELYRKVIWVCVGGRLVHPSSILSISLWPFPHTANSGEKHFHGLTFRIFAVTWRKSHIKYLSPRYPFRREKKRGNLQHPITPPPPVEITRVRINAKKLLRAIRGKIISERRFSVIAQTGVIRSVIQSFFLVCSCTQPCFYCLKKKRCLIYIVTAVGRQNCVCPAVFFYSPRKWQNVKAITKRYVVSATLSIYALLHRPTARIYSQFLYWEGGLTGELYQTEMVLNLS
jgi:hypothetical protein